MGKYLDQIDAKCHISDNPCENSLAPGEIKVIPHLAVNVIIFIALSTD